MPNEARTIVLASRNQDKLRELRQIFAESSFNVVAALDYPDLSEIIEDGTTALGNATRKAVAVAAHTGEITVADDTSFQIRTLGGLPDIFASRFAGPAATYDDNVELALELMAGAPDAARQARFETSMVWIDPRPAGVTTAAAAAAAPGAVARWLHDPRQVGPANRPTVDQGARRRIWSDYLAQAGTLSVSGGVDTQRLVSIAGELVAPFLAGGRPTDAAPDAIQVPDTRAWTTSGPDGPGRFLNIPTLAELPATAPGRSAPLGPVWLELSASGRLLGNLGRQRLGAGGFGYDPIFVPVGGRRTLAELEATEKNAISHRARALRRLVAAAQRVYESN